MIYTPISGVYVALVLSLLICGTIAYILGMFWFGDVRNRRLNSFFLLGIELFLWTLLNAVSMVCNTVFFPVVYTLRMVTVCIVPFGIIWFVFNFIGSVLCRKWLRNLFIIIASADILFLVTNPVHHLYFVDYKIPIPARGFVFWVHTLVAFLFIGVAFIIYIQYMIKTAKRNPLLVLAGIGMMIPYAFNILYSTGTLPITFDITPIGFFFTFIFFVLAAYRSGLLTQNLELKTAQRTMTAIFESNPHINVMFDSSFNILDCNPSAIEYMDFSTKEELIAGFAERMTNSIPPLQWDGKPSLSMVEVLTRTIKDGYYSDEITLVIGGKTRIIDLELKRIPYGDSFALLGYMTDLTDVREKEEALAQRTAELEATVSALEATQRTVTAIFESNPHINVMFDSSFQMIDCNPSAIQFMGFETKEEMLSGFTERFTKSIPEFQPGGQPSIPMSNRFITAASEGYSEFETELYANGKRVIVDVEIKRIPYGDSYALLGFLIDLTAEREREKELLRRDELLEAAIKEAQAANQAKSAFLANMSHEIRTPMNSIMGFAELALDKAISPHVKEYLGKITDSTKWLLRIINDILDISKIESGKIELEKVPFDLHSIFMRCQSVIHPSVNEKGLDLRVYAEPPIGKRLLGDPVRLYQALMNLLSNAVKFTSAGSVRLSSAIKDFDGDSMTVYFEVKDSGIGMTSEQIKKIFDPFMQADSSTTRNYGGTGLGLAIAKSIVELMGGMLTVESEPGAGSTFCFQLMFDTIEATDAMPEYTEIVAIEKPTFDGLILVCEDNPMNQQVISEHLARVGLRTVIAENGKIGVEMVRERIERGQRPFDMIFMDIFMPVMDGVEAALEISGLGTKTPIIAMTANMMSSELDYYKKSGMSDCVGKPFTTQELWRCLLKYLALVSISVVNNDVETNDNDELQRKLRVKFVRDNKNKYAEIIEAIATSDFALAHRLAHTLKSNAGQIGKNELQNVAAEVEALLKDKAIPADNDSMNRLRAELDFVFDELKPLCDELTENGGVENMDAVKARALFERLETMLVNINPECVNLIDEIRSVPGAEELALKIEDYDFESAARTLVELKKDWV